MHSQSTNRYLSDAICLQKSELSIQFCRVSILLGVYLPGNFRKSCFDDFSRSITTGLVIFDSYVFTPKARKKKIEVDC
jgi:hypothetical protein